MMSSAWLLSAGKWCAGVYLACRRRGADGNHRTVTRATLVHHANAVAVDVTDAVRDWWRACASDHHFDRQCCRTRTIQQVTSHNADRFALVVEFDADADVAIVEPGEPTRSPPLWSRLHRTARGGGVMRGPRQAVRASLVYASDGAYIDVTSVVMPLLGARRSVPDGEHRRAWMRRVACWMAARDIADVGRRRCEEPTLVIVGLNGETLCAIDDGQHVVAV